MKLAILLCLYLTSMVSAAPPFFNYLPHYGGPRQAGGPTQVNNGYPAGQPPLQPGAPAAISMEIVFPHRFAGGAVGGPMPAPSYPSQGYIKYSLPKAPGRKSVEIYYPYDFTQNKMMPNFPSLPQIPNPFPYEYPPQNVPQQTPNIPSYDANPPPPQLQGASPAAQQDQSPVKP